MKNDLEVSEMSKKSREGNGESQQNRREDMPSPSR